MNFLSGWISCTYVVQRWCGGLSIGHQVLLSLSLTVTVTVIVTVTVTVTAELEKA